jgi:hypothetical protein
MAITVIQRLRADIQIPQHDDLPSLPHELLDTRLEVVVVIHLVQQADRGGFVQAVCVDQHEKPQIEGERPAFRVEHDYVGHSGSSCHLPGTTGP